jgi:chlorobactene glucosyltransferase
MTDWAWLVALPALAFGMTLFNLLTWRRGTPGTLEAKVEVLIPARNESGNIIGAIESILAEGEREPGSVLVTICDDGSTDGMGQLLWERYGKRDDVRVIEGKPLPPGWVGKPFACQQLLENAKEELLLFMDADVRLEAGGLGRLVSMLSGSPHAQVLTAVPRQKSESAFERLVMPLLIVTYTSWLPLRLIEWGRDDRTVAANGQLLMMRRRDCESLGGFESVKHEIVDDVAFCRLAKRSGLKVVFADGFHVARCRMYDSAKAVYRGFSKNMYEGIGGSVFGLLLVTLLYLSAFVVPFVALPVAWIFDRDFLIPAAIGVGLNLLLRLFLAIRFRQPPEGVVTHPLAVLTLLAILFNSFRWSLSGNNEWAGRRYAARKVRQREGSLSLSSVEPSTKGSA